MACEARAEVAAQPIGNVRRDLALDLVAQWYPRDTALPLRARDRASSRDPTLELLVAQAFPRQIVALARRGKLDAIERLLLHTKVDPSFGDDAALRAAAAMGWTAVVRRLMADPRTDPAAKGDDAIRAASANGHLAVVELLLTDPRVNPAAGGCYLFF
jgi:hypothetical protein